MKAAPSIFNKLALAGSVLAFVVIVLGAWVRLSDAGLGCPDWPGCYGQLTAPDEAHELARVQNEFPGATVESGKAWKEMVHRYFAGTLGLVILVLAIMAWRNRHREDQLLALPILMVGLVMFQAALGMWTVTMLLRPAVVTLHLLMGMLTLGLLWWLWLWRGRLQHMTIFSAPHRLKLPARLGLILLFAQIALGGWTSTNYAALHCADFPTCQGQWLPPMNFSEAFELFGTTGTNYEGGQLSWEARIAIHVTHRIGALLTLLYLSWLGISALRTRASALKATGAALLVLLLMQVSLGIANVLLSLPLPVAVAHNGGAALLLLALITLNYILSTGKEVRTFSTA